MLGLGYAPMGPYEGQGLGDGLVEAIFPPTGPIWKIPIQGCSWVLRQAPRGPYEGRGVGDGRHQVHDPRKGP